MSVPTELGRDEEKQMPATAKASNEVFDEIDKIYFENDGFDSIAYELSKMLGEEFEIDELERERFKLKKQLRVVSQKVSGLITKNSAAFSSQIADYEVIQSQSNEILERIVQLRGILQNELSTTRVSLGVVAAHRKKRALLKTKKLLETLNSIRLTGFEIKELMRNGDFPSAIKLCVQTKINATSFYHFDAIRDFCASLCTLLSEMESNIDDALASSTVVFNIDKYSLVQAAYQMLGNTECAAKKLEAFFHGTVESSARSVLIELLNRTASVEGMEEMDYESLCKSVPADFSVECLQELGLVLCKVLGIYHTVLKYHVDEDERILTSLGIDKVEMDGPQVVEKGIFQVTLINGLQPIFKAAATKYDILLGSQDLSRLKYDEFVNVLEMTNRFRKFGRVYFGHSHPDLSITLERQMGLFFGHYHRERMGEVRMFLEHEIFALCPVPLQFTLFDLPEFLFLKESGDDFDMDATYGRKESELEVNGTLTLIKEDTANPFLSPIKAESPVKTQRNGQSIDRSSSEESRYGDDNSDMERSMPNVCNTALNLLKFFGRYIKMTSMLHSIAGQVIQSVIQLFDYFFFLIYEFFARDLETTHFELRFTSPRLLESINYIRSRISAAGCGPNNTGDGIIEIPHPSFDLKSPDNLFSLSERIVGVESTIFLAKQLELLRPVLESLLPPKTKSPELVKFYKTTLGSAFDLREAVYGCVASRVIDFGRLIKEVGKVKWDISELKSEHNGYIDGLTKDLQLMSQRLEKAKELIHLSIEVNAVLWTQTSICLFRALVQAYSECSKRCSSEGRALMLLDLDQLNREMESLSGLKPMPHKSFAEDYVKAYYLPESCLEDWISLHPDYSGTHIASLVAHTKKTKSSIIMTVLDGKTA